MKVMLKGNTSKKKYFYPATAEKPATLYFEIAEKIKKRNGDEATVWHKVRVTRGYAETIYRGLHGDKEVSRFIQIEGRITSAPEVKPVQGQTVAYNTIWADEVTWLDNKWPENESGLPEDVEEAEPAGEPVPCDEETPW